MAGPQFEIEVNAEQAEQALRRWPNRTARATMRSLNRSLTTGRAVLARLISQDMGLRIGDAKDAILVEQASAAKMEIRLKASLRRLPLVQFNARQTARGVTYKGGSGRSVVPSAFLATMSTGHTGVFKRVGKPRLPIKQLYGPSIGHVFIKHRQAGTDAILAAFDKNLEHELAFAATEGA